MIHYFLIKMMMIAPKLHPFTYDVICCCSKKTTTTIQFHYQPAWKRDMEKKLISAFWIREIENKNEKPCFFSS